MQFNHMKVSTRSFKPLFEQSIIINKNKKKNSKQLSKVQPKCIAIKIMKGLGLLLPWN